MIFFGWGRKNKTQQIDARQALILSFNYFHLFWLFRVAFGLNYSVATLTDDGWATRRLSPAEVEAGGAATALTLHWWWRFGLLIGIAAIVVIATLASIT
ncbi:hypothetical protein [Cellulomonas timonensis]|uniref:hypothetical protein n=1 Tax=Cellulomonas timonensis TaxID=1689271 RepID=UPI000834F95A|nr:hypothetical protein [Cellulomonas timonensis]